MKLNNINSEEEIAVCCIEKLSSNPDVSYGTVNKTVNKTTNEINETDVYQKAQRESHTSSRYTKYGSNESDFHAEDLKESSCPPKPTKDGSNGTEFYQKDKKDRRPSIFTKEGSGFGWMCVLGSFFVHAIIQGCFSRSSGILQIHLEEQYGHSTSMTAWIFSIINALQMTLAPLASTICNVYSCRVSAVCGGAVFGLGLLISALVSNFWTLYFSYGVLGGIGAALAYGPAVIIVCHYFKDRNSFPIGIATSGSGCGSFAFPILVQFMLNTYGLSGAFLLLSGIAFNICVFGMLFRPAETDLWKADFQNKTNTVKKKIFNIRVLKNPYFTFFCIGLMFSSANRMLHFVPSLAATKGLDKFYAASLLSASGIAETLSRIGSGYLLDMKCIRYKRIYVYAVLLYALGLVTFVFPHLQSFEYFIVIIILYGCLMGCIAAQKSVVLVDVLGVENIADGNGILTFSRGVGVLGGPPLVGYLKDISGDYINTFYLSGGFSLIAASCISVGLIVMFLRKVKRQYYVETITIDVKVPTVSYDVKVPTVS